MKKKVDFELKHIDEHVRRAILKCLSEQFNNVKRRMAEKIGLPPMMVTQWVNRERSNMEILTWNKVYPYIKIYLDDKYATLPDLKDEQFLCPLCSSLDKRDLLMIEEYKYIELNTPYAPISPFIFPHHSA